MSPSEMHWFATSFYFPAGLRPAGGRVRAQEKNGHATHCKVSRTNDELHIVIFANFSSHYVIFVNIFLQLRHF